MLGIFVFLRVIVAAAVMIVVVVMVLVMVMVVVMALVVVMVVRCFVGVDTYIKFAFLLQSLHSVSLVIF